VTLIWRNLTFTALIWSAWGTRCCASCAAHEILAGTIATCRLFQHASKAEACVQAKRVRVCVCVCLNIWEKNRILEKIHAGPLAAAVTYARMQGSSLIITWKLHAELCFRSIKFVSLARNPTMVWLLWGTCSRVHSSCYPIRLAKVEASCTTATVLAARVGHTTCDTCYRPQHQILTPCLSHCRLPCHTASGKRYPEILVHVLKNMTLIHNS
jgi:hypothetical protein